MFSKNLVLVLIISGAFAEDAVKSDRTDFKKQLSRDCDKSYSPTCLKLDIVSWVDKLNEEDDVSVFPGVSVVREVTSARSNTADIVADLARDFPNDPDARLDAFLVKKVSSYLDSHSLKLNLWNNNNDVQTARGGGEGGGGGGGGKKGGGGLIYLAAAGAMMKGVLGAAALAVIALIAKKALFAGVISLLISAIIGLKSLTHHGKSTTYEVIAKPIHTHADTHSVSHEDHGHYGHSSYGRSLQMPLPLGLQEGYKPPQ